MPAGDDRIPSLRRAADQLARRRSEPAAPSGSAPPWEAAFFGLDRVARFRDADDWAQRGVLDACAQGLLAESWWIEQCGIGYCARMTLAAESDDERRLFALIGADEALHATWLSPWIEPAPPEKDSFNRFIAGIAEAGGPQPLAYLLQVVLEGFGIAHYGALAAHCRDGGLAGALGRIARDEALHHAGGLAAFRAERLTAADRRFLEDAAQAFLQMIRCGPQRVVSALGRAIGVGDRADAASLFADLDAQAAGAAKLQKLRRLMAREGMEWLVDACERLGLFEPCSPHECAQVYASLR